MSVMVRNVSGLDFNSQMCLSRHAVCVIHVYASMGVCMGVRVHARMCMLASASVFLSPCVVCVFKTTRIEMDETITVLRHEGIPSPER